MKRISMLCAVLAVSLVAVPLQAQYRYGVLLGISTGKTLEEFEGDPRTDDDNGLLSIAFGVSLQRSLTNSLTFAPEMLFVAKGFSDEASEGKIGISYIEVPILFRLGFETTGSIKPFLTAGPQFSLQIKCTATDSDGDDFTCNDVFGSNNGYKELDGGFIVGGGLTRDRLSLNVRYDLGLMNVTESDGWVSKHRALMILLGLRI